MAHDVFVSYSSDDKAIADAVCAYLERDRIRCWIAPRDILPGENYGAAIVNALNGCEVLVLVFSSKADASPHVTREVERAVSKGSIIVPLRIENVLPSEAMEYFISSEHWLDAVDPPLERHLQKLVQTVQKLTSSEHRQPTQKQVAPISHLHDAEFEELAPDEWRRAHPGKQTGFVAWLRRVFAEE